jgi:hypothetical protein
MVLAGHECGIGWKEASPNVPQESYLDELLFYIPKDLGSLSGARFGPTPTYRKNGTTNKPSRGRKLSYRTRLDARHLTSGGNVMSFKVFLDELFWQAINLNCRLVQNSHRSISFTIQTLGIRISVILLDLSGTSRRQPIDNNALLIVNVDSDVCVPRSLIAWTSRESKVGGAWTYREVSFVVVMRNLNGSSRNEGSKRRWNECASDSDNDDRSSRGAVNEDSAGNESANGDCCEGDGNHFC